MRTLLRPLEPGDDSPWWKDAWQRLDPVAGAEWGVVALIALVYAAFKTYSMWVHDGDEHIYFAMAQAVAHGKIPYWDFFFAHPPVHLLVPAVLFAVFGFSYGLALWIAPLACLAAGLALWRLVRRFAPGWVAVLTMILFLFGRTVLQSSSHLTGVNIGLLFLCWGAERLAADKPKTGGVLLALSVLTGIYFLPASVGVLAVYAFYRPRRSLGVTRSAAPFEAVPSRTARFGKCVPSHSSASKSGESSTSSACSFRSRGAPRSSSTIPRSTRRTPHSGPWIIPWTNGTSVASFPGKGNAGR